MAESASPDSQLGDYCGMNISCGVEPFYAEGILYRDGTL
jgi:hypothetical protein